MAGKVIGVAEFAGIRETYQRLLHLHTALGPTDTFTGMDDFERRNGTCRSCRGMLWPCDFFRLTAANLELLELLDGSRFADDWPGPVKDRRW